jgi:ABC-2 type transport system permease protein
MLYLSSSDSVVGLVFLTVIAYVVMAITGNWLIINFGYFLCILLLAAPSLVGFGLIISGLALLFKRVEMVGAMLTLAIMGLVALDGLPLNVFTFLPFVSGASLARDAVLDQNALKLDYLLIVIANSLVYLTGGIYMFKAMKNKLKKEILLVSIKTFYKGLKSRTGYAVRQNKNEFSEPEVVIIDAFIIKRCLKAMTAAFIID